MISSFFDYLKKTEKNKIKIKTFKSNINILGYKILK